MRLRLGSLGNLFNTMVGDPERSPLLVYHYAANFF